MRRRLIPTCKKESYSLAQKKIPESQSDPWVTYHPIGPFRGLGGGNFRKERLRLIPLLVVHVLGHLHHLLHRVGLQQVLIVEVVEEEVDALLHVLDLGLEALRRHGFDACDFGGEKVDDGLCFCGDVGPVAPRVFLLCGGWWRR